MPLLKSGIDSLMLKKRLLFGTLMTIAFAAIVLLDGVIDGAITKSPADDKPLQATILAILIASLMVPAQLELSKLAAAKGAKTLTSFTTILSILLATGWYWQQFVKISPQICTNFLLSLAILGLLYCHYACHGISGALVNCGVSSFGILYLGILSSFALGIRIDFGLWSLLMVIFTIKSADIGAYAIGSAFGKHKFSPKISPGKTWEGMAGAVAAAVIVAILFAALCGIMVYWLATIFGIFLAFVGQLGDLAESLLKRDAEQKDSSSSVPGFGGILDVIDSPLGAMPFAYIFLLFARHCV
jgi:phosphatidate cytidylyltransferase